MLLHKPCKCLTHTRCCWQTVLRPETGCVGNLYIAVCSTLASHWCVLLKLCLTPYQTHSQCASPNHWGHVKKQISTINYALISTFDTSQQPTKYQPASVGNNSGRSAHATSSFYFTSSLTGVDCGNQSMCQDVWCDHSKKQRLCD